MPNIGMVIALVLLIISVVLVFVPSAFVSAQLFALWAIAAALILPTFLK